MSVSKVIEQPIWNRLIEQCKNKIEMKYKKYGNSWKGDSGFNSEFWKKRLQDEVDELMEKLWKYPDDIKVMNECIDVVNIVAMIYTIQAKHYHDFVNGGRGS